MTEEDGARWEVVVKGDSTALGLLREVLTSDDLELTKVEGEHVLRCNEFDRLADAGVVRSRARELVASLAGAARLILGWTAPLEIGGVARRHPDGTRDYFLEVDSVRVETRVMAVTLKVTRADGTEEIRRPGDPAVKWLRHARDQEEVRRALRLVAEPELGWVELYRILDVVLENAGASIFDWASKKDIRRFKHTANSVGAVGDEARHGRERADPPSNPMSLDDAQTLVLDVVRSWLSVGST